MPTGMHTIFSASVIVMGVISSERDVTSPHFFEKGHKIPADAYIPVLETLVKPFMDRVAAGRNYLFPQDPVQAYKG